MTDAPRGNISGALVSLVEQWAFSGFVLADISPLNEKWGTDPLPGYLFLSRNKKILKKANLEKEKPFLQDRHSYT